FARARRRHDQPALAHAERRHQIHDARRITIWLGLELDPLVGVDGRKLFERPQALIFGWLFPVDREQLDQLRTAIAPSGFAINPHAVAQAKTAHDFGRDENVLRRLDKVSLGVSQETKTFAGNLDDAFAEFRLTLNLFAVFYCALGSFSRLSIQRFNAWVPSRRIDSRRRMILRLIIVLASDLIGPTPITSSWIMAAGTVLALFRCSRFSFQRSRLVLVFLVHK